MFRLVVPMRPRGSQDAYRLASYYTVEHSEFEAKMKVRRTLEYRGLEVDFHNMRLEDLDPRAPMHITVDEEFI